MIHYHTYKNIELLNQGVYQIKSKIYTNLNNKKYYAIPYFSTESKDLENLYQTDEQSNKNPFAINSEISENNYEYTTKSFFIKYADEEIELDEFCYLKLYIFLILFDKHLGLEVQYFYKYDNESLFHIDNLKTFLNFDLK